MIRTGAAGALVILALGVQGCASLMTPAPLDPPVAPAAAANEEAATPVVSVQVQAPKELSALLRKHLDISRVTELASGDALDASEWTRLISAAPAQVRELVETEGYFDATARVSRQGDVVRVELDPGPRAVVQRVDVEVQGDLERAAHAGDPRARATLKALVDGWALPVGKPFRNSLWADAKADMIARMRAAGYASANWSGTAAAVDTERRSVRVFVVADSGPLFVSGELQIEGLERHDAETVRNIASFGPGTPVTETMLLDFQDRLRLSGLFDGISITFDPQPSLATAVPIRVRLKESVRQIWTVGIGMSADTGPRASLENTDRRPFGLAAVARNKIEWGAKRQAWEGEISTHPLEKMYRNLLGGAIERLESDTDVVRSQRLRIGRTRTSVRDDRLAYLELETSSRDNLAGVTTTPESTATALSGNYHVVWRRLDNVLLPTSGYSLSLQGSLGVGRGTPGERGVFSRTYGRVIAYRKFGDNWFSQARLELGQMFRPKNVPVPDTQLFRAGGDDSVRGYAYRSLAPVVDGATQGGDALFSASIEIARPFLASIPELWAAAFIDAGRAAASFSDLKPAIGVGVGVRYRSPVGPLRLDLAWGEEVRRLRLHFSVGVSF